jgi:AcrR family transcriptional regulator
VAVALRKTRPKRPRRPYHHGDLRRALLQEAVRTIREEGVQALTLRAAGKRLGVSRTALYRHFTDKSALLAGVAREGFQRFRDDLLAEWHGAGGGLDGFARMGVAYVRFALTNPSHYRVMFGEFSDLVAKDPELEADAHAAFAVLVDALAALQESGAVIAHDRQQLAQYIWGTVHGVAMLAINGQLGPDPAAAEALARFAVERLEYGIATERGD